MIVNLKNPTDLSGLYFVYKGSTNLEKKGWYGISHYMEHLVCKNIDDLLNVLQENGISWNAYTSNNVIVFYFTGLERYLAQFRDVLIERMKSFSATPEECEKEKKIVLEEYMDGFTEQYSSHSENFFRRYYGSYSPIGLKEDIEKFTYQDCLDFYDLQYKEPDCIINISRTFELKSADIGFKDRSGSLLSNWGFSSSAILEPTTFGGDKTAIIWNKALPVNTDDYHVVMFINSMLISGLNSPLYQEIREKRGLVYYLHCYSSKLGNLPCLNISTMTSDKNVNELESVLADVLSNKEKHLTSERLELVRKSSIISREKKDINRYSDISDIISPDVAKLNAKLETLTLDEIFHVYDKYYSIDNFIKNKDRELL
jgi:predicted Zn-dependent peptidase